MSILMVFGIATIVSFVLLIIVAAIAIFTATPLERERLGTGLHPLTKRGKILDFIGSGLGLLVVCFCILWIVALLKCITFEMY